MANERRVDQSAAGSLGQITGWSIVGQRDFNGDGDSDLLWRDGTGDTAMYLMNGTTVTSALSLGNVPSVWSVVGVGNFAGVGYGGIYMAKRRQSRDLDHEWCHRYPARSASVPTR